MSSSSSAIRSSSWLMSAAAAAAAAASFKHTPIRSAPILGFGERAVWLPPAHLTGPYRYLHSLFPVARTRTRARANERQTPRTAAGMPPPRFGAPERIRGRRDARKHARTSTHGGSAAGSPRAEGCMTARKRQRATTQSACRCSTGLTGLTIPTPRPPGIAPKMDICSQPRRQWQSLTECQTNRWSIKPPASTSESWLGVRQ